PLLRLRRGVKQSQSLFLSSGVSRHVTLLGFAPYLSYSRPGCESCNYALSKPDILSRMERDEELCAAGSKEPPQGQEAPAETDGEEEEAASRGDEGPMEADTDAAVSKPDVPAPPERDEEPCAAGSKEPPQGQDTPRSQERPEPPQAPAETDGEEEEEALGGDEGPMEADAGLPILVMNVTSRSAQDAPPGREQQPEAEEAPAEVGAEGGLAPNNEAAAPHDVEVKEEEPEALPKVSTSSRDLKMQKCSKKEEAKAKSKKKPSRCPSGSLLTGTSPRGYVREWSHPCTECGKRFRLKINLIIHQRSHAKEGPYECAVCEISFADKSRLDLHQSIHADGRAFGAKVWGNVHPELRIRPRKKLCGALYGAAPGLEHREPWLGQVKSEPDARSLPNAQFAPGQRRRTHEKPVLKCSICKKILSCPFSLRRHLKTHARDRPHHCNECKKSFTRGTHLRRHQQIHERQR
ncbi:PREDICTED: zinc finger protein 616-like, partial [Tinamus guttatus]